MKLLRCPYCDEPLARTAQTCPLCGEIVQSPASASIAAEITQVAELSDDAFLNALISDTDLSGAYLRGADLFDADLHGANLHGADLGDAFLSNADLSCADLSGANLYNADLTDANLCGADLSDANLRGINLTGARYDLRTIFPSDFNPIVSGAKQISTK